MKKLIVSAILFILPAMFCFASNIDKPQQKSVSSQIRVIIPPFAIIHLGNNVTKAVPINTVSNQMKSADLKSNELKTATVEANTEILTISESKTEKTATEIQVTTTYTSTQL